jgi:hypothetical protein
MLPLLPRIPRAVEERGLAERSPYHRNGLGHRAGPDWIRPGGDSSPGDGCPADPAVRRRSLSRAERLRIEGLESRGTVPSRTRSSSGCWTGSVPAAGLPPRDGNDQGCIDTFERVRKGLPGDVTTFRSPGR